VILIFGSEKGHRGEVSLGSAGKKSYGTWARLSFNLFFPLESQIRNRQAV
jgi:hypothetical protein